jgi:hypothetical protein
VGQGGLGRNPRQRRQAAKRQFVTAFSRLLNALQAGSFGCFLCGAVLANFLFALQAHIVNKLN